LKHLGIKDGNRFGSVEGARDLLYGISDSPGRSAHAKEKSCAGYVVAFGGHSHNGFAVDLL